MRGRCRRRNGEAALIERIEAAGKLADFAQAIAQVTPLQQFRFSQVSSIRNDSTQVNAVTVIQAMGVDAETILDLDLVVGSRNFE